jgi:hypothetical protein
MTANGTVSVARRPAALFVFEKKEKKTVLEPFRRWHRETARCKTLFDCGNRLFHSSFFFTSV